MEKRSFKVMLMIFSLCFSYLLISCVAVPTTRSLMSNSEPISAIMSNSEPMPAIVTSSLTNNVRKSTETEDMIGEYLRHVSREHMLVMESTDDYPPTGSNPKHDPPPPPPAVLLKKENNK
ncbi:hypothetical protein V6N12_053594 [Hibiscus sabdariffa]|uniref:Transmembrane protein n=1 Tax=Hibiscus sabdariffa TaxID=183260 RepID=A0ABR2DAV5_9ROSI